jgi:hypothetical protein
MIIILRKDEEDVKELLNRKADFSNCSLGVFLVKKESGG